MNLPKWVWEILWRNMGFHAYLGHAVEPFRTEPTPEHPKGLLIRCICGKDWRK